MSLQRNREIRVPPEAFQTILLDEIAARLEEISNIQSKILQHLQETTPEGVDFPIPEVTVTNYEVIDFEKVFPHRKIRAVDFFNKGPNTAYIRINHEVVDLPVEDREELTISRPRAEIKTITIRVKPGEKATLRMLGHY